MCARDGCRSVLLFSRVNSKLRNETPRDKTTADTAVQRFSVIAKLLENSSALISAPPLAPAELRLRSGLSLLEDRSVPR